MNRSTLLLLPLAFAGLALYLIGCDSASNPVAPSGATLIMTANPTKIAPQGESSTISVSGFKADGNPLNPGTLIFINTDVGFIASQSNCQGTGDGQNIFPADDSGKAVVFLCGDGSSVGSDGAAVSATVTASLAGSGSGGGTGGGDGGGGSAAGATASVTVVFDGAPQLSVFANPSTVGVGGRSTITVVARDDNGFPVGAGETINLIADLGRLSSSEVQTDSDGEATAVYTAGERPGSGMVTAFLGNATETAVTITINDAPSTFTLNVDTGEISAASESMVEVTVEVQNSLGSPLSGASVTFEVEDANGGSVGGSFSSGSFVQSTDSSGRVVDTLTIPQGQLMAGVDVIISATVRGEGVELPPKSRRITVTP